MKNKKWNEKRDRKSVSTEQCTTKTKEKERKMPVSIHYV